MPTSLCGYEHQLLVGELTMGNLLSLVTWIILLLQIKNKANVIEMALMACETAFEWDPTHIFHMHSLTMHKNHSDFQRRKRSTFLWDSNKSYCTHYTVHISIENSLGATTKN